jgi:hypothetical protein
VVLFRPQLTYRTRMGRAPTRGRPVGENPPNGAIIDFYVKAAPAEKQEVKLEILDSAGKVIRTYSSLKPPQAGPEEAEFAGEISPKERLAPKAGMNRFVWDLRYESAPKIPGYSLWEYEEGTLGPLAVPGQYQVRLTAEGKTLTETFEVKSDPRLALRASSLQQQFDLAMKVHQQLVRLMTTVNQIRSVDAQLKSLEKVLGGASASKPITTSAAELEEKLRPVEDKLIDPKITASEDSLNYPIQFDGKLAQLFSAIESADAPPTRAEEQVFEQLNPEVEQQFAAWNEIQKGDLAAFNDLARKQNVQAISVPKEKTTSDGASGE